MTQKTKEILGNVGAVVLVLGLISVICLIADYQMSRPVMDVNSKGQAVRIKFEDDRVLKPGDSGFNEARKKATVNPVH